ncbi:MAG: tryptophanase [Deltaproteobacteria bacterium]|nr:tryptophanase [Deltaproteobacteria bacterium]
MNHELPFESYLISVARPIKITAQKEREQIIREQYYNLFKIPSPKVMIDMLTDSGTGAISNEQLAGIIVGDESYAGSVSFEKMKRAINDITGFNFIIPTHQGRGAENVLHSAIVKDGDVVPGNTHFDTTKAHIEFRRATAVDCTIDESKETSNEHPFRGNLDLKKLEAVFLKTPKEKIPFTLITITCNSGGGQPVSLSNILAVKKLCKKYNIRLFFDMARFAENAYFIKTREKEYQSWPILDICREMFKDADGATMSAKKDAIVAMGGFVALKDEELYQKCATYSILFEGYLTYGGMTGGTMEALAIGLYETTDFHYLQSRITQVHKLGRLIKECGIPLIEPVGGHAVYVDAGKMLPHIPHAQYPAQVLAVALYVKGGIRGVEIGTVLADRDPFTHQERFQDHELLRLAVPRRTFTDNHMAYVASVLGEINKEKDKLKGLKIIWEPPILRHFTCRFAEVD